MKRDRAGRADKGIILTTGTFTAEARREAVRDGVPPIELVDGEKLLDMFERFELGQAAESIRHRRELLRRLQEVKWPA